MSEELFEPSSLTERHDELTIKKLVWIEYIVNKPWFCNDMLLHIFILQMNGKNYLRPKGLHWTFLYLGSHTYLLRAYVRKYVELMSLSFPFIAVNSVEEQFMLKNSVYLVKIIVHALHLVRDLYYLINTKILTQHRYQFQNAYFKYEIGIIYSDVD